jgi:hypothetical protein
MLFDLKGKRRRTVQGVYLTLAILMGAGLVLFGIGSSVNGGLFDAFNGGGGGSSQADKTIQKRIDTANKTLQTDPKNAVALAALVRGHYDLASTTADAQTSEFTKDSLTELRATDAAWQRYTAAVSKPDPDLARRAVQAEDGLGRLTQGSAQKAFWSRAAGAAEILAAAEPTPNNYIALVQYATLAGQTRKADLAGKKAVQLAPKPQKKTAQQTVAAVKANPLGQAQGGQTAPGQ